MITEVNLSQVSNDADAKVENSLRVIFTGGTSCCQRIAAQVGGNATGFIEYPRQRSAPVRDEKLTRAFELLFADHPADGAAGRVIVRVFC